MAACDTATLRCQYTCAPGTKECQGKCIAMNACCADGECPMKDNQVGKCDQATGQCQWSCAADTKPCGGKCIARDACCDDKGCTGNFSCVNNSCSTSQCQGGYKLCGGKCIPNGGCCSDGDCKGNVTCGSNNTCTNTCRSGYKTCDGKCISNDSCCGSCSGTVCQNDDEYVRYCDNGTCKTQFSTDCASFGCSGGSCRTTCPNRTIRKMGMCVPCGGRGQPCCQSGDACNNGNDNCSTDSNRPDYNTCVECGYRDQICCKGRTCKDDRECAGGDICY